MHEIIFKWGIKSSASLGEYEKLNRNEWEKFFPKWLRRGVYRHVRPLPFFYFSLLFFNSALCWIVARSDAW